MFLLIYFGLFSVNQWKCLFFADFPIERDNLKRSYDFHSCVIAIHVFMDVFLMLTVPKTFSLIGVTAAMLDTMHNAYRNKKPS